MGTTTVFTVVVAVLYLKNSRVMGSFIEIIIQN